MAEHTGGRLNRRRFLMATGAGAAAVSAPIATRSAVGAARPDTSTAVAASAAAARGTLELDDIQGNVVAGFNKDHQVLLFVAFAPGPAGANAPAGPTGAVGVGGQRPAGGASTSRARAWLADLAPMVANATRVAAFNDAFRTARASGTEASLAATWVNVAFSHVGLRNLGRPAAELTAFPTDFRDGMRKRAGLIGDTGLNAPDRWPTPYRSIVDAVVIVAADRPADLEAAVAAQQALIAKHGLTLVHTQTGAARSDQPGHEHFGFKDGISQPGLRGFTRQENPANPNQGIPGQDLLWPGEFVLGYPRQAGPGGGDDAGPIATSGPTWTVNGSYLVFRRLTQDVAGFRAMLTSAARTTGLSEDLIGAKIIGRYKSGAALSVTGPQPVDPGVGDATLLSDARINDFEFEEHDADGALVPLASHIRKTYPRDETTDDGGEEDTQTHRLLRRGIPFGESLRSDADPRSTASTFPNDRGLLFLCYQTSIERQFEHVQRHWVNDPDFPRPGAGEDPVITQTPGPHTFAVPGTAAGHVAMMQRFVTTTGGEYFFQPSITAIRLLSGSGTTGSGTTGSGGPGGGTARRPQGPGNRQGSTASPGGAAPEAVPTAPPGDPARPAPNAPQPTTRPPDPPQQAANGGSNPPLPPPPTPGQSGQRPTPPAGRPLPPPAPGGRGQGSTAGGAAASDRRRGAGRP